MKPKQRRSTASSPPLWTGFLPTAGTASEPCYYHIGLIELDWLYTDVLESAPLPEELAPFFAWDARDADERLSPLRGETLEEHLHRLDLVRQHLLVAFGRMTVREFRRPRVLPRYRVTPEWVLQHLIQHEGEHRGQIQLLRDLAEQALGAR